MKEKISFIIKALNEEDNIANCIESCLYEADNYESEVILVDSISTDRTVEIAKKYPIKIIQFSNKEDASCGSAPQLGYQESVGDFIFLIDGDMTLAKGFVEHALVSLKSDVAIAGVSGITEDTQILTTGDTKRALVYSNITEKKTVTSLGGGGLYKRSAIESVGYFSHRNLRACEELELGVRLSTEGYKLIRLPINSVSHNGHIETSINRLVRLWKTGRTKSYSIFLSTAFGKPWFFLSLKKCWFLFVVPISLILSFSVGVYGGSLASGACALFALWVICFFILLIKNNSIVLALDSIASWWVFLLTIPYLFFYKKSNPTQKIEFINIERI